MCIVYEYNATAEREDSIEIDFRRLFTDRQRLAITFLIAF